MSECKSKFDRNIFIVMIILITLLVGLISHSVMLSDIRADVESIELSVSKIEKILDGYDIEIIND